jgi:hypothetical protein
LIIQLAGSSTHGWHSNSALAERVLQYVRQHLAGLLHGALKAMNVRMMQLGVEIILEELLE